VVRPGGPSAAHSARGWRNVDFGYTVTLQIRAWASYPTLTLASPAFLVGPFLVGHRALLDVHDEFLLAFAAGILA
jgi:hypothetical protein